MKLIARLIFLVRKENLDFVEVDSSSSLRLLGVRFATLLRGNFYLVFKLQRPIFFFKGRSSRIISGHKVRVRRGVTIKDNVVIDATRSNFIELSQNVSIGRNVIIDGGASLLSNKGDLSIGANSGFSENCLISVRGKIRIGEHVIFGPGVNVFSENHGMKIGEEPFRLQSCQPLSVTVEDNVWVGSGSIILGGSYIEKDVVVAAGSVVRGRLRSGHLYGGVPVRMLKKLD